MSAYCRRRSVLGKGIVRKSDAIAETKHPIQGRNAHYATHLWISALDIACCTIACIYGTAVRGRPLFVDVL